MGEKADKIVQETLLGCWLGFVFELWVEDFHDFVAGVEVDTRLGVVYVLFCRVNAFLERSMERIQLYFSQRAFSSSLKS